MNLDKFLSNHNEYDERWIQEDLISTANPARIAYGNELASSSTEEEKGDMSKSRVKKKIVIKRIEVPMDCSKVKRKSISPKSNQTCQVPVSTPGQGLLVRDFVLNASVMFAKMDGFGEDKSLFSKRPCQPYPLKTATPITARPTDPIKQLRQEPKPMAIARSSQLNSPQIDPININRCDKRRRLDEPCHLIMPNHMWSPATVFDDDEIEIPTARRQASSTSTHSNTRMDEESSTSAPDETNTVSTDYHPSNEDEDGSIEYLAQRIDDLDDYDEDAGVWQAIGIDDGSSSDDVASCNSAPPSPSQLGLFHRLNGPSVTMACTLKRNTKHRLNASSLLLLASRSKSLPSPVKMMKTSSILESKPRRTIKAKFNAEAAEYQVIKSLATACSIVTDEET